MTYKKANPRSEIHEPIQVIGVSGQSVIIGKPEAKASVFQDPVFLLAARRQAHEKAVKVIMEHRKELLRTYNAF
ncbi:hypothetical protein [Halomonas sp. N3-2A]|uniref:hypothetical protein n=1 Tax=Halomonas sp. N3-2A TaxID=2014541 RepID=UPI000B5B12B1|nr:hypothetical protein [Halomonas sp. N3-2A]ASK17895.1 hypothetical protein CEK60_00605 [Halomonas sp. N3-2A]